MNLSQTWQEFVAWIAEHWLLGRLFISSLELLVLAVLAALALQLFRPRTPRLVALVWALVLAKPILSLLVASPISLLRLPAPPEPQVAAAPVVMKTEAIENRPQPVAPNVDPSIAENQGKLHGKTDRHPRRAIENERATLMEDEQPLAAMPAVAGNIKSAGPPVVPVAERFTWLWSALTWLWLAGVALMVVRSIFVRRQLAHFRRLPRALG